MSGLDKNRIRNKTVSFRMSPQEIRELEAKLKASGKPKGEFIIDSILKGEINIIVGRYESDRLAVEIKRLREQIDNLSSKDTDSLKEPLLDSIALFDEVIHLMKKKMINDNKQSSFYTEK